MRQFLIGLLIMGMVGALQAEGNGGYAGSYLRLGLGARGIAMGNAQVATAGHGFGFFYNPSALPYLENLSANFSYSFLSLDRRFYFVGLSTPIKPDAGLSVGWIYSGVGDIMSYDSRGVQTGEINHGLHGIFFSFGVQVIANRLSIGVNGKYLLEKLSDEEGSFDYTGKGAGADVGAMFRVNSWISLGAMIKDVNSKLKSNTNNIFERGITRDNSFPVSYRVGTYLRTPLQWARVAYDFEWSSAGEEKNHLGLELVVPGAAGRIGYDNNHLTFGAGVEISTPFGVNALLDYAFVNSVIDEGVSHVFTWQFEL